VAAVVAQAARQGSRCGAQPSVLCAEVAVAEWACWPVQRAVVWLAMRRVMPCPVTSHTLDE
jgi:hypothetical protein